MTINDLLNAYANYCRHIAGLPPFLPRPKAFGKSGNLRYDGVELFSYDKKVARLYPEHGIALVSSTKNSVTTSRHIGGAVAAMRKVAPYAVFVPDIDRPEAPENVEYLAKRAKAYLESSVTATVWARHHYNEYRGQVRDTAQFCAAFNLSAPDLSPQALLGEKHLTKFIAKRMTGDLPAANG